MYFSHTHGDAEVFCVNVSKLGTHYAWSMSPLEAASMHRIHPQHKTPILRMLIPANDSPDQNDTFAEAADNGKS